MYTIIKTCLHKTKIILGYNMRFSLISAMLFLSAFTGHASDPKHEVTKTISKSFKISKTGNLTVENKYGNVKVETWDRDEVSFQIEIKVAAASKSKAEEAIDRISITFSNTSSEVSAVTEIDEANNSGFWSWINNSNQSFKIHYYIKCPKSLSLDMSNKYGNITLPDWNGNAVINLKYGNINAQNMTSKTKLFLSYGGFDLKNISDLYSVIKYSDGTIGMCQNADLQLSYSDITITSVQSLKSENKYSKINIDEITSSGSLSGNYNNYKIRESASLIMNGSYSDLNIQNLLSSLETNQAYGGVTIGNVSSGVKSIKFEGKYTGLTISNMRNFTLKYSGKYSTPTLPAGFDYRIKDKDGNSFNCEGSEGNGKTNVQIITSYGGVKIR